MGSNVESVLPRKAAVVIHEEKLEAVSHDADELHHLQCGHVLLPPDVFLQDNQYNAFHTTPILQIVWLMEFACNYPIDMKWKRPTNDQGLLSIYHLLYRIFGSHGSNHVIEVHEHMDEDIEQAEEGC